MFCENDAADFNSEISFIVFIEKDINIRQMKSSESEQMCELSSEETTVILSKNLQLSMKSTKRRKIDTEQQMNLLKYLYDFVNEEKDCLCQILLLNYQKQCSSIDRLGCCSNCDLSLQICNEFNICIENDVAISRHQNMFNFIRDWILQWLCKKYAKAVWTSFSNYIISDKQIDCLNYHLHCMKKKNDIWWYLPDWNCEWLDEDLNKFFRFAKKNQKTFDQEMQQLLSRSKLSRKESVSSSQNTLLCS